MYLGKVIGTVVSTIKTPSLTGSKFLIVEKINQDLTAKKQTEIAVDTVGAGDGETVIVVGGSSARMSNGKKTDLPVDAAIIGIVDTVEISQCVKGVNIMSNIYTKTGDKGTTGLYGGSRVDKDSLNVDAYGTVDEAISSLGVAYTLTDSPEIKEYINHIQKRMFQAGAELASDARGMEMLKDKIGEADIKYLENIIDKSTEVNGLMREFVVPGVNPSSAALHVARTVVRRAERIITALAKQVPVREELRKYINRLSDACFAMARLEEARAKNQEIEELKDTVRQVVKTLGAMGKEEDSMDMSIETLKKMAGFIEEKAKEIGVPVAFSAVDEGGNLLYFQRMEGTLLISTKVSQDKAYTACALKCPTCDLADVTKPGESLWSLHNSGDGRIICFGGGYPIKKDGKVIGAIGVSGGTAEEDMAVATYALEKMQGGKA